MLFPLIDEVEEIRTYARAISPEFLNEFDSKFYKPFVAGQRFFNFRTALNRYLNVCVGAIENPQFDTIDLRRCLSDEGDVRVWATHIGRGVFPVLKANAALLHWHQTVPENMR